MYLKAFLLAALPAIAIASEYKIEKVLEHECKRPTKKGDPINVHYRGTLEKDGSQFDASYDRGQPLSFKVGSGMVIKGWDQGLLDMCPGDKRKLTIPPELGYGDSGVGPIPGGATLIFETELVSIDGVEKEDKVVKTSETEEKEPEAEESAEEPVAGEGQAEETNKDEL